MTLQSYHSTDPRVASASRGCQAGGVLDLHAAAAVADAAGLLACLAILNTQQHEFKHVTAYAQHHVGLVNNPVLCTAAAAAAVHSNMLYSWDPDREVNRPHLPAL